MSKRIYPIWLRLFGRVMLGGISAVVIGVPVILFLDWLGILVL